MEGKLPLVLILLVEIVTLGSCEMDNPFGFPVNEDSAGSEREKFALGNDDLSSEDKSVDKRLSFYVEGNEQSAFQTQDHFEEHQDSREYMPRRKVNYSEAEKETPGRFPERSRFNNENIKPYEPVPEGEVRSTQMFKGLQDSYSRYDWEKRGQEASVQYQEGKNLNQFSQVKKDDFEMQLPLPLINNEDRQKFNKFDVEEQQFLNNYHVNNEKQTLNRVSNGKQQFNNFNAKEQHRFNDFSGEHQHFNEYHEDMMGNAHSRYRVNPGRHRSAGFRGRFVNPDFHNSGRGLVINFNAECPVSKSFDERPLTPNHHVLPNPHQTVPHGYHLVPKMVYTPKSYLSTHSEVVPYKIPERTLVASNHMSAPLYYV